MAAFDVVANEASRTLLLFSALLLIIWYFLGRKVNSVLLVSSLSLLFLVFVLNPFFIIGIMLLVVYMLINFFSRYEKRNQYTHIVFSDYSLQVQKRKIDGLATTITLKIGLVLKILTLYACLAMM